MALIQTKIKNANDENLALKKSDNFIDLNAKINYVALGDSITAGFDGTFPDDFPGKLENNQITGSSYPAFLAKIFNNQNRIALFNNYAKSGGNNFTMIKTFWY
ncbi:SGNH/GDSL hydrolase family protein [Mycoplasmopsis synoviae]|uniref:SGNH/GDSL hydrolase family protein n=1 Tax=Mycoplasmopsis synoviae TaxID=2109 RepID=UPI003567BB64